jgi:hypothetical protein
VVSDMSIRIYSSASIALRFTSIIQKSIYVKAVI